MTMDISIQLSTKNYLKGPLLYFKVHFSKHLKKRE